MRFIIFFVAFGLCLVMGACPSGEGELDIDIGDYEYHFAAWNNQSIPEYKLNVYNWDSNMWWGTHNIIVKNGITESNACSKMWLEQGMISTIPQFYSLIKNREKSMKDEYDNGGNRSLSLKVSYNTEYHYPNKIISKVNGDTTTDWTIDLMPLEEGELDIDIGDYEYHLEAWNSQNMLNYQISMERDCKTHTGIINSTFVFNVKNGIPDKDTSSSFFYMLKEATVPEIYSFIKEEEERIRNVYNGINRPYLHVQYDTEYHYPTHINSGVDFFYCRLYDRLEITLTPDATE